MIELHQLRLTSPYAIQHITDVSIDWKPGAHGKMKLQAIGDAEKIMRTLEQASAEDLIELQVMQEQGAMMLFKGWVQQVECIHQQGVHTVEITGMSASSLLDVEKRSRSFPEPQQTYGALIRKVMSSYTGGDVILQIGENAPVGEPILQYDETDWAFVQRVASRIGSVVVSDMLESGHPKLWVGMPQRSERKLPDELPYQARKNLKAYHEIGATASGLHDTDYFSYEIQSDEWYVLGEQVEFRGQRFVISQLQAKAEHGELLFTYQLSRPEGIRNKELANPSAGGISLAGEVLAVRGEEVKLRLDIDKDDGVSDPHWYPFAPATGSAMYCLPQVGTHASLYYPDATGSGPLILDTVRKNGGGCAKTGDTNTRYFGTEHGSELKLAPDHVQIQKDPAGAMLVSLNDETGIEITSSGKLTIIAEQELELFTPKSILLTSPSLVAAYKKGAKAGLAIENEYQVLAATVHVEGRDRTSYEPFDDEPKAAEPVKKPPFNWGKLWDNVAIGIAAVAIVVAVSIVMLATAGIAGPVIATVAIAAAASGVGAVGAMAYSDYQRGEVSSAWDYATTGIREAAIGAISGAIFGPYVGATYLGRMAISGGTAAFENVLSQLIQGKEFDWGELTWAAGLGSIFGAVFDPAVIKGIRSGFRHAAGAVSGWVKTGVKGATTYFKETLQLWKKNGNEIARVLSENSHWINPANYKSVELSLPNGGKISSLPQKIDNQPLFSLGSGKGTPKAELDKIIETAPDYYKELIGKYGDKGRYYARTLEEYESLAKDPAKNFKINEKSKIERLAGLELEARGDLPGPIVRDPNPAGAEFIDATGVKWDVKGWYSKFAPKGYTLEKAIADLEESLAKGENVIIDSSKMFPEHIDEVRKAVKELGIGDKLLWWP